MVQGTSFRKALRANYASAGIAAAAGGFAGASEFKANKRALAKQQFKNRKQLDAMAELANDNLSKNMTTPEQLASNANAKWGPGELPSSFYTDTHLEFDGDNLNIVDNFSDGATNIRDSFSAVSGSSNYQELPDGDYIADNLRTRTKPSMVRDGVGYSMDLTPTFETTRDLLRIHPDGNQFGNWALNDGTAGCIGLQVGNSALNRFYNFARIYTYRHQNIRLTVQ